MKPFSMFLPLYRTVPLTSAFLAQPAASRASARPRSRRRAGRLPVACISDPVVGTEHVEPGGLKDVVGDETDAAVGEAGVDAGRVAAAGLGLPARPAQHQLGGVPRRAADVVAGADARVPELRT